MCSYLLASSFVGFTNFLKNQIFTIWKKKKQKQKTKKKSI